MKYARSMLLTVSALALAVGAAFAADDKRQGFNDLDKDKDGALSRAEAAAKPELNFKDMDRNNDGKVSRAEYLRVMAGKDAGMVKRKVTGEDRKYPGFNDLDKDKDGALSKSEAGGNPDLAKKFKQADKDGDGKLTRSEYLAAVTGKDNAGAGQSAKAKSNDPGFNKLDKDNDGALSRTEAAGNAELAKKFKEADKNSDGKLSRAEYLSVMVKKDAKTAKEKVTK